MKTYMQSRVHGGKLLAGVQVTENICIGISTLDELETYGLRRPSAVEDAKVRELKNDDTLRGAHAIRDMVQRRFDKARRHRAESYAGYINGLFGGKLKGAVPPITLFSPSPGSYVEEKGALQLPHKSPIVVIDGETQTEARFNLREDVPETGSVPVMFVLYHGISEDHAGTIMHDFNHYAHPVAETKIASLNANGALTKVAFMAIEEAKVHASEVARFKPNKEQFLTMPALIAGAAGAVTGTAIIKRGGLAKVVKELNAQINGIDHGEVIPFLLHAIELSRKDARIGRSEREVWALAGGVYCDNDKRLLTVEEWHALRESYKGTKPPRGTHNTNEIKRNAALSAIGLAEAGR